MDRQLAERMVGAACLLAVLVLVVPAILDGSPDSGATITHPAVEEELDLRTHTIRLDGAEREPPVPTPRQAQVDPEPTEEPAPARDRPGAVPAAPPAVKALPVPPPSVPVPATSAPEPPAKAPAKPPAKAPAIGAGDWIVQLGSFSSRANADRLAADVQSKGFSVSVEAGGGSSGTLFRVRAGPAPDKAGAEALAGQLAAAGFKGGRVGRR